MTKISKNIKRLRTEKGFTQDTLAEKINITRQAVSSWENDRTQPDIDMLERLSEVFDVSIEELIYGKKRNTNLELEKTNYNNTLTVVFSILGSLLVGVGLVLIFITFWKDMPLISKGVLSFLPLLLGQASGIFVLAKKKDKVSWCEGGSVLWTAGIAATLTLIYNIFDLSIDWQNILVLISVSVFPIMVILKSVSPLVVYYACGIAWGFTLLEENSYSALVATVIIVAAGWMFSSYMLKKENKSHRSLYSHWISMAAVVIFTSITGMGIGGGITLGLIGLGSTAVCLFLFSFKDGDMAMPYKIPGIVLTSFSMFIFASGFLFEHINKLPEIVYVAVCAAAVIASAVYTKCKTADKASLAFAALNVLSLLVVTAASYVFGYNEYDKLEIYFVVLKIIALAANILMIISGGREKKLLPINVGFVSVAALTMLVVIQSGFSMFGNGIMLLVFGGILLVINFRISKAKQKTPALENNEEVEENEK